ncbi:MAG: HEPN domain-containing protein [Sulfuritalea sp.]|nr:HEPN domain-containing protein [Sulfuritalea sp.]
MDDRFEEAKMLMHLAAKDEAAFRILLAHPDAPLSTAMFHGQQAVEKAMKAMLSANRIFFPPSHNLLLLAELFDGANLKLPVELEYLGRLNPYAVTFRYDDREINTMTKEVASSVVDAVLRWAQANIPSEPQP